jgi:AraC family transcriptional regulator
MRPVPRPGRPDTTSADTGPGENRPEGRSGLDAWLAGQPLEATLPTVDEARISGPRRFGPFDSRVPGPDEHVLVTTLSAEGRATWRTALQTRQASLTSGALTLVPRGHDGHWRVTGSGTYQGLFLGPARLKRCSEEVGRGNEPELSERLQVTDPTMFKLMRLIGDAVESWAMDRVLFLEQLVDLLCLHLLRSHSCITPRLDRPPRGGLAPWQTHRVVAYMKERLDQDVSLQDLADVVRLSRFHFCTAFRLSTGSTPHEMLTRLRLDEACRLLTSSKQSISEIALSVGFQTPSAFAARFWKAVGSTPRDFRRSRGAFTGRGARWASETRSTSDRVQPSPRPASSRETEAS